MFNHIQHGKISKNKNSNYSTIMNSCMSFWCFRPEKNIFHIFLDCGCSSTIVNRKMKNDLNINLNHPQSGVTRQRIV